MTDREYIESVRKMDEDSASAQREIMAEAKRRVEELRKSHIEERRRRQEEILLETGAEKLKGNIFIVKRSSLDLGLFCILK